MDLTTLNELMRVVKNLVPDAKWDTDDDGNIVVLTYSELDTRPVEGTCNAHVDVHYFRNDPDPCIGWRDYPLQPDTDDGIDCDDCGAANGAHYTDCVWMP